MIAMKEDMLKSLNEEIKKLNDIQQKKEHDARQKIFR